MVPARVIEKQKQGGYVMSDALYLQQLIRENEKSNALAQFSTDDLVNEVRRRFDECMKSEQWAERVHDHVYEDGYSDPYDTFTTVLSMMTINGYA